MISRKRLQEILDNIGKVKIAVYGDFCLDVYWMLDKRGSEFSVETGQKAHATGKHYYSPGGASNLVANLAALKPATIRAIGTIGNDIYGKELISQLKALPVNIDSLFIQEKEFDTYAFVKEYLNNEEISRTDFGVFNKRSGATEQLILDQIENSLEEVDVFIFNQQVPGSIPDPEFIARVSEIFKNHPDKIMLLDSRHYGKLFEGVSRKLNEREVAELNNATLEPGPFIPVSQIKEYARSAFKKYGKPLYITLGDRGMLVADHSGSFLIPGIQFLKQLDPVGAGDTALSALALSLATGANSEEAGCLANLAASVTVQKRFTTGTATAEEILKMNEAADLKLNIEISENESTGAFFPGTAIEIIDPGILSTFHKIKHIVFDHDGTISILRRGWKEIMINMMVHAIAGDQMDDLPAKKKESILQHVMEYVAKSTGIQTILQMEELVQMVLLYGFVPENRVKTKEDYKAIFIRALNNNIKESLSELTANPNRRDHYIIPGSMELLDLFKGYAMELYLASGTDHKNVIAEANLMGYADYFNDHIYGSLDDTAKFSKKLIIEKIIHENNLDGEQLMLIGDGPVEIREGYKKGATRIGIASEEENPGVINHEKRKRLIQAGAQIIIPDYKEFPVFFQSRYH